VCHCGANIGSVVDVPATVEYALTLPNVVYAQEQLFSCATNSAQEITDLAKEKGLNRVVVAACSPRTLEPLFPGHPQGSGAQSVLLRHGQYSGALFLGALQGKGRGHPKGPGYHPHVGGAGAALLEPLAGIRPARDKAALVVGGGIAGMTCALSIAQEGMRFT
jgi:heterodisulfide reductase subunit A